MPTLLPVLNSGSVYYHIYCLVVWYSYYFQMVLQSRNYLISVPAPHFSWPRASVRFRLRLFIFNFKNLKVIFLVKLNEFPN